MSKNERPPDTVADGENPWVAAMPVLFVLLWSTGFVVTKYGLPDAPPASFLTWRFVLVIVVLLPIIMLLRAPWPARAQAGHLAVAGVLMQAGYLGGVFGSINLGMSAGVSALIVGLQPVLTAFAAAPLLGERVTRQQWLGLALGLGGTALVVWNKVAVAGLSAPALALSVVALLSITAGTVYQKRFCGNFDLRTGAVIQFAAALVVMSPIALLESRPVVWSAHFIAALAWLVVVLSIFTIGLLAILIRRGAATKVASFFYLVPPVTAVMGFVLFGETLTGFAMLGMLFAVVGVALVVRQ